MEGVVGSGSGVLPAVDAAGDTEPLRLPPGAAAGRPGCRFAVNRPAPAAASFGTIVRGVPLGAAMAIESGPARDAALPLLPSTAPATVPPAPGEVRGALAPAAGVDSESSAAAAAASVMPAAPSEAREFDRDRDAAAAASDGSELSVPDRSAVVVPASLLSWPRRRPCPSAIGGSRICRLAALPRGRRAELEVDGGGLAPAPSRTRSL